MFTPVHAHAYEGKRIIHFNNAEFTTGPVEPEIQGPEIIRAIKFRQRFCTHNTLKRLRGLCPLYPTRDFPLIGPLDVDYGGGGLNFSQPRTLAKGNPALSTYMIVLRSEQNISRKPQ